VAFINDITLLWEFSVRLKRYYQYIPNFGKIPTEFETTSEHFRAPIRPSSAQANVVALLVWRAHDLFQYEPQSAGEVLAYGQAHLKIFCLRRTSTYTSD
jgi:hypothetical protein